MVGIEAARMIVSGQVVGLGTGSTAAEMIRELGRRVREEGLSVTGVATSFHAAILARGEGIAVRTLEDVERIDIAIDGADEVDPAKNLIKGGGGAHTREKVIASFADRFVVVVDDSKLVSKLGEKFPVPVEAIPMALPLVMRRLRDLGGVPEIRMGVRKDGPVVTDQGNIVIDVRFNGLTNPAALEAAINAIPGVLENGIFAGLADRILVASPAGVRRID